MVRVDRLLAPDERVHGKWVIRGNHIIVTDRRLIIKKGRKVRDIALHHIVSIEAETTWGDFIGGIVLVILGAFIAAVAPPIGALLVLVGIIAAIWGWLNRHKLIISYGSREFKIKNGGKVIQVASQLRNYTLKVKATS